MGMETQRKELAAACEKLFQEGTVKVVIAFTKDEESGKTTPFFLRRADDIPKLAWDETCAVKLAKYLLEKRGKVGIVAKPCDARAIVMLINELQVKREDVVIFGMDCPGMKNADGTNAPGCENCSVRVAPLCDIRITFDGQIAPTNEKKTLSEDAQKRLEKFRAELKKCILCYSCRQACWGCYCTTCFMDRTVPNFLPGQIDEGAKMTYHLGRAMHLAGRCVECGECERVCPSNVDVRFLIEELTDFCKEEYDYVSGLDVSDTPALSVFKPDDREVGFLGGE